MCTRNRPELIAHAVRSVLENQHDNFEFIIIDQSSDHATRTVLHDYIQGDSRLRYVHTTKVGLSAAYNAGIGLSTGELLAFTDDDCVASDGWLSSIEEAFGEHPAAGLLYGQVCLPKELEGVPGTVPTLVIDALEVLGKPKPFKVYGMGANFAARRLLFDRVGLFDEALGGGGPLRSSQDSDLQFRVHRAGIGTVLSPATTVLHYGLRTEEQWPATLVAYGFGDGAFYMKHARCGDATAILIMAKKLVHETARVIIRPVLGRDFSLSYIRGFIGGMRGSFRFPVNRAERLYVLTAPPKATDDNAISTMVPRSSRS